MVVKLIIMGFIQHMEEYFCNYNHIHGFHVNIFSVVNELTSARWVSRDKRACFFSELSLVIKLLLLLNMYSKLRTPNTMFISHDCNKEIKCSTELYRCLENECSIRRVVKLRTLNKSSLSCKKKKKLHTSHDLYTYIYLKL